MCNASLYDSWGLLFQLLGISGRYSKGMKMPGVLCLGGCNIVASISIPFKFLLWVSRQFWVCIIKPKICLQ